MKTNTYLGVSLCLLGIMSCTIKEPVQEIPSEKNPIIYSWIEIYADGHMDTIFSKDTLNYPSPVEWTFSESSKTSDTISHLTTNTSDTVYLNYGPNARDSLQAPVVQILNKQEIANTLDSILLFQPMVTSAPISAVHFRGDSLKVLLSDTSAMALFISPSTQICMQSDSCSIGSTPQCTNITFDSNVVFKNALGISLDKSDSFELHWKVMISNRFGFRDSLLGSSIKVAPKTQCSTPRVSQCQNMRVYVTKDTLFSWIELYADQHQDTVYNSDSSVWPGANSISLFHAYYNRDIDYLIGMNSPVVRSICPGDSLTMWPGGTLTLHEKPDTIRLNYGPDSLFPLVTPRVTILNRDSLLSKTDTAQFYAREIRERIKISHFRGDSASIENLSPSSMDIGFSTSILGGCVTDNPCDELKVVNCIDVDYGPYYETWPYLTMTVDSTSSGTRDWKFIVRNRFGFADTLEGSTRVLPFTCPTLPIILHP